MAKKIYNVTFANGTIEEYTSKKAVQALEGIATVTVNGQDITNEFIKEDNAMAEKNEYTEAIEAIETVEAAKQEVAELEGPKFTVLFTASRGTNKKLNWYQIEVKPEDETTKVKGCAAELPIQVAEALGKDKFVAWVDQSLIERFIAEGKPVRGMASTISDIFNRYIKVTELKGADKNNTVYNVFREVIADIETGTIAGGWEHEPEEVEEPEAPAETTENTELEAISTDVEDIVA